MISVILVPVQYVLLKNCTVVLQGNNGRFELLLEKDGQPFEVFDVAPQKILNEASLLLRVLQPEAIDYEVQHSYSFQVISTEIHLITCSTHFCNVIIISKEYKHKIRPMQGRRQSTQ